MDNKIKSLLEAVRLNEMVPKDEAKASMIAKLNGTDNAQYYVHKYGQVEAISHLKGKIEKAKQELRTAEKIKDSDQRMKQNSIINRLTKLLGEVERFRPSRPRK